MIVALGRSQAFTAASVDPEKDLAIQQQGEKLDPWKAVLSSELLDLPRRRQQGEGGCNLRIANPEQRTGARRFQDHLIGAASQVGKPRQHDHVGIAKLWRLRPIIGNLRFDNDLVHIVGRAPEAVLHKTAPGQSTDQQIDFLVDQAVRGKRTQWQACAKLLRSIHRAGAEFSQANRMAIEAGEETSVRVRFERDVSGQPGGNGWGRDPPAFVFSGSAQAGDPQVWGRNGVSSLSNRGRSSNPSFTGIS
jgi:hypothetical protein